MSSYDSGGVGDWEPTCKSGTKKKSGRSKRYASGLQSLVLFAWFLREYIWGPDYLSLLLAVAALWSLHQQKPR